MGRTLRLETVAEGIEERVQHHVFTRLGCDLGQGYLFSRPLDPQSCTRFMRQAVAAGTEPLLPHGGSPPT